MDNNSDSERESVGPPNDEIDLPSVIADLGRNLFAFSQYLYLFPSFYSKTGAEAHNKIFALEHHIREVMSDKFNYHRPAVLQELNNEIEKSITEINLVLNPHISKYISELSHFLDNVQIDSRDEDPLCSEFISVINTIKEIKNKWEAEMREELLPEDPGELKLFYQEFNRVVSSLTQNLRYAKEYANKFRSRCRRGYFKEDMFYTDEF